jgi:2'-5' RNA ligase
MNEAATLLVEHLLEESYSYSSTQINLPENVASVIIQWGKLNIPDDNLYFDEEGGLGRETEIHVTVKYGLTDPVPSKALLEIIRKTKPFTIKLTGISLFEQEKYDVVKLDVESEALRHLNAAITAQCDNEDKHPEYVPHVTIAYVKKGTASKILGQYPFENNEDTNNGEFEARELKFSGKGDDGIKRNLPFSFHAEGEESPKEFMTRRKVKRAPHRPFVPGQALKIRPGVLYYGGKKAVFSGYGKISGLPMAKIDGILRIFDWHELEPLQESSSPFDDLPFPVECSELPRKKRHRFRQPEKPVL